MERERKSDRGSRGIVPSACEWVSPGEISFGEINDLRKAEQSLRASWKKGTSLPSSRSLSPLLFVLSQILNVPVPPLAVPCISACLNIIISGEPGGIWWKGHNQRTIKMDYIKMEEWVWDREQVKKINQKKKKARARLVSIALTTCWGFCTWVVRRESWKSRNRLIKDNQPCIVETSISHSVPHYFLCRHVNVLHGKAMSEKCYGGFSSVKSSRSPSFEKKKKNTF